MPFSGQRAVLEVAEGCWSQPAPPSLAALKVTFEMLHLFEAKCEPFLFTFLTECQPDPVRAISLAGQVVAIACAQMSAHKRAGFRGKFERIGDAECRDEKKA
jgi:hypothetical protein